MYSLFVGQRTEGEMQGWVDLARDRFLEYTSASIITQIKTLSVEAVEAVQSWPCILMREGRGQETAYLAKVTSIKANRFDYRLGYAVCADIDPFVNDWLWKIRSELDIEQFEFHRHHFAVKDCDLFSILTNNQRHIANSIASAFGQHALPSPARAHLLETRTQIAELSHSQIDDLLIEAGVDGLEAGRAVGSRRDRANAIVAFSLKNPTMLTAENSLFSAFLARKSANMPSPVGPVSASAPETMASEAAIASAVGRLTTRSPNRVFIVHGRNEQARQYVASFLKQLGLEGIVLHEQPNMGRHLLTKFIEEADLVTFAIVLMTDDDLGGFKPTELRPRARQNVILELGYFLAHLGQQKVCAMITPGLETPSDFDGIVYIPMDIADEWKSALKRELEAAGLPVQAR